jgi:methylthioribose-1-phosphate isomerase
MTVIEAVRWSPSGDAVRIIDQRLLPGAYVERDLRTVDEVCDAIRTLAVRGAPAIGICGAMGLVAAVRGMQYRRDFRQELRRAAARRARPTASISRGIDRMRCAESANGSNAELLEKLTGRRPPSSTRIGRVRGDREVGATLLADGDAS